MTRTRSVIGVAVGLGLVLTGCRTPVAATKVVTAATTAATSPTSTVLPVLRARPPIPLPPGSIAALTRTIFSDPGSGGRFVPPSPEAKPRLGAAAAWAAFQRTSAGSDLIGEPFTMVLAEYSNNVVGPVPTVDTVSTRAYSRPRLTWLLVWRLPESALRRGGPAPEPGSTPPPRTHTRTDCGFEDMIDATTGRYQGAFSGCGSSLLSVVPPRRWGTLTGVLAAVGGPAPGTARPMQGTVTFRPATGAAITVLTDPSGTFAAPVPIGRYTVTGRSPLYEDGNADCRSPGPVTVTSGTPTRIDVYCQER